MYNFYNNTNPEKRSSWRNAYEVKMAALEHDKRRFQLVQGRTSLEKPQVLGNRKSGWVAILRAPLRLLAILIG
jgi:hypothetical protein